MLNVGIISCWHVHTNGYVKQLRDSGKVAFKAMWDSDEEKGRTWAKENGIEFMADYDAFLAREDIVAVICNAPTTMHFEIISKAVRAGKHVFTEKLLTTNTKECEELCRIIEEAGITFTISLPLRCSSKMLYAKKLIEDGSLGKISAARMRRSHSGVSDGWLPGYWFDTSMTGGGAMMDLGAHSVYLMPFLLGNVKRVNGMTSNFFGTSSDENAVGLIEFESGAMGICETAFVTYGVPDLLEVYGSEGSLFIHGNDVRLMTKSMAALGLKEARPENLPMDKPSPLLQFVDACIEGTGTPQYLGTADALVMTEVIEAIYSSDTENRTVVF